MKRKKLIVATSIGFVVVIGALIGTLVLTSTLTTGAKSHDVGYTLGNNVAQFVLPYFGLHAGVTSKS